MRQAQVSEMDIPSGVKIDLSGKVAFVSGASKGIGVAIAEALADAGADLALTARDEGGLEDHGRFGAQPGSQGLDSHHRTSRSRPGEITG